MDTPDGPSEQLKLPAGVSGLLFRDAGVVGTIPSASLDARAPVAASEVPHASADSRPSVIALLGLAGVDASRLLTAGSQGGVPAVVFSAHAALSLAEGQ